MSQRVIVEVHRTVWLPGDDSEVVDTYSFAPADYNVRERPSGTLEVEGLGQSDMYASGQWDRVRERLVEDGE